MASQPAAEGLPGNTAAIMREVIGIARTPGSLTERAEALLAQLQRVVRFDAGWITLLPADQDAHVALARSGYDERVCGFLDSPALLADVERVDGRRLPRTFRLRDLPVQPSDMLGWGEYLEPAGFRDAVGAGLFTADGRYLGVVTVHTAAADQMSEATRDLIGLLAAPIAAAVDPWRLLARIAGLVARATAGVVLGPSGAVLPLPGLPGHQLLAAGSGVLAAATAQRAAGGPHVTFLAPLPTAEDMEGDGVAGAQTHARITVLAAPPDVRRFAGAVVLVSPAGELHGLSRRELQVLGWLVTGAPNQAIAQELGISTGTLEVHEEQVRAKLGALTRTAAAARALRLGLFVPPFGDARA